MGNRGLFGYRLNHSDKVTYSHRDSAPAVLGLDVLHYVAVYPLKGIRRVASQIHLVDRSGTPSPEEIQYYEQLGRRPITSLRPITWLDVLRSFRHEPRVFHDKMKHMLDDSEFLENGLYCEWAYIINLDSKRVEVYRGLNRGPSERGRYKSSFDAEFEGVEAISLEREFPISKIRVERLPKLIDDLKTIP